MNIKKLVLVSLISCLGLPSLAAASSFKVGNVNVKAAVDPATTAIIAGEDLTLSIAGGGRGGSGMMTLIFKGVKSEIVKGATFDITTGQEFESGKVNVNFMLTTIASSGKSTSYASDEESGVQSGTVKITSADTDSFTATLTGKITTVLKTVTDPLNGNFTGTESRIAGSNISAKFTGAL